MKATFLAVALLLSGGILAARAQYPFIQDSLTRGLWHLNEETGSVVHDSSMYHNDGTAVGTTIVEGPFGRARWFNGNGDYISIPSDSSMNLGDAGFMLDAWFKTTQASGVMVRRGLAPVPGYDLMILDGHVVGEVGANVDPGSTDPLLHAVSTRTYNDNLWHHARLVRDRSVLQVLLYVDDTLAAAPIADNLLTPIVTDHALMIGRWDNYDYPQYFNGAIAEVRLWSPYALRHSAARIQVARTKLDFGNVLLGEATVLPFTITNAGFGDTLKIDSIVSSLTDVVTSVATGQLAPGETRTLSVTYQPVTSGRDSGTISLYSNDQASPVIRVSVTGRGIMLSQRPTIDGVSLDPSSSTMARIVWFRSANDTADAEDPVIQYSVWGRNSQSNAPLAVEPQPVQVLDDGTLDAPWQFLAAIPAVGFDRYALNVTHPYSSWSSGYWNECVVAAQTVNHKTFLSIPDTLAPSSLISAIAVHPPSTPQDFDLSQNYPNPFNPKTGIRVQLSGDREMRLIVYDLLGREVAVLANGRYVAGEHTFTFDGSTLPSGTYFYRLTAGKDSAVRKMVLTK